MYSPVLDKGARARALAMMAEQEFDVLVVGGGATGAGVALDAVSRGLSVAIVEAQDWSAGTSSRSSRLIHGGLRYLYQFNVPMVAQALRERELLRSTLAPHLVSVQPFVWPLLSDDDSPNSTELGMGSYDLLAFVGAWAGQTFPAQKHLSAAAVAQVCPALAAHVHRGAIRFFDARVDDSRLVIAIVRTAMSYGAVAASRAQVDRFITSPQGAVLGARVHDREGNGTFTVRARHTVNATGVWTQRTQALAGVDDGLRVLASKGIHLVVPKACIDSQVGLFVRTSQSLIFASPWDEYWLIGSSDTPYHGDLVEPVATCADIDFVLGQVNTVLARPLSRQDIIATYAGLRPLVQATTGAGEDVRAASQTKAASREHVVMQPVAGLSVVAGGKLTTYRVMAQDTVDAVLAQEAPERPCITDRLPLMGAYGYEAVVAQSEHIMARTGWSRAQVTHLLHRYGSEIATLEAMVAQRADLRDPLSAAPNYLRVEVVFAARYEGALHVEDVLRHRLRLSVEQPGTGEAAAAEVAALLAPELGWSQQDQTHEVHAYLRAREQITRAQSQGEYPGPPPGDRPTLLTDSDLDVEGTGVAGTGAAGSDTAPPAQEASRYGRLRLVPDMDAPGD